MIVIRIDNDPHFGIGYRIHDMKMRSNLTDQRWRGTMAVAPAPD
jgi:hypothetical protein